MAAIAGLAAGAAGGLMGLALGGLNDSRQYNQQARLQRLQIKGNKEMTDYEMMKQLEMWENTSYGAQKEQMLKAGLNPALMYGMSGGGGQSVGSGHGSVTGATAPTGGGEVGMGIQSAMQLALMDAQKKNIEADTKNKEAGARNLTADAEGKGLENAFTAWMQGTTPEGEQADNIDKSIRGQKDVTDVNKNRADTQFKLDENERQKLLNNATMNKIGEEISLMKKKGLSEDEIYKNLSKQGLLLDAEIEWNKLDISGNPGKFITNIIKMLFKPR